jgi:hypothetical protein
MGAMYVTVYRDARGGSALFGFCKIGSMCEKQAASMDRERQLTAVMSPCGQYRYRLDREIALFGQVAAVVMVNPSTADAETNDATIRRIIGFGERLGWSRVIVGNVFAYKATDIRALAGAADPIGPDNSEHLRAILDQADVRVVAWGTLSKLPSALRGEWRTVFEIATARGLPLKCFGVVKDGHPRHPLMLKYDLGLVDWRPHVKVSD